MAVMRWDPWGELAALQRDVNDLFGRSYGTQERRGALVPPIDVHREDTGLVVRAELPGLRPDDVEITVHEGVLTLAGERRLDEKVEDDNWIRRERAYGRFERSFTLPKGVDLDQVSANFENGVLELRVPHAPEATPRRIQVGGDGNDQAIDVESA